MLQRHNLDLVMMHLSLQLSKEQFAAYPTAYTQLMVMQPFPVVSGLSMTPTQPMLTPSMQCSTNQGTIHMQSLECTQLQLSTHE